MDGDFQPILNFLATSAIVGAAIIFGLLAIANKIRGRK